MMMNVMWLFVGAAFANGDVLDGVTVGATFTPTPEWRIHEGRQTRVSNLAGVDGITQIELCGRTIHNVWFITEAYGAVETLSKGLAGAGWSLTRSPSSMGTQTTLTATKGELRRELTGPARGPGATLRTQNTAPCLGGL